MNVRSARPWLLAAALLLAPPAVAQQRTAEALFREGRELLVAGRFSEACERLEQSQRLEPRLGTQLNVAFCQQRLGKLATAWLGFRAAASAAQAEGDVSRERFASERAEALGPRVPRLMLGGAAGSSALQLSLDGSALDTAELDAEEGGLPLDPGAHTLIASAGGQEYWRTTVTLRESEQVTLAVPEPPPALTPLAPAAPGGEHASSSGFVYELGAFAGFLYAATSGSSARNSPSSIPLQGLDGDELGLTCASAPCEYLPFDSGGLLVGLSGFAGYALAPHAQLGLRVLAGLRATGGALLALGPSASLRLGRRYRLSPAVLFGTASHENRGLISAPAPGGDTELSGESTLSASLGFSLGLAAELGVELLRGPSGALVLQATPLVLFGPNGNAWLATLGAAYRWN